MVNMKEYMKAWYADTKDSWGDFEREYYDSINMVDNIRKILYKRYGSIYRAEKELGYIKGTLNRTYNMYMNPINLKGLKRICKALNISFQYAVFGGREESLSLQKITFKNLYQLYKNAYWGNKNPKVGSVICGAAKGRYTSVPLKYLIRIAREQRVTIDWLLGG